MAENTTTNDRTETERFDDAIDADDLIEGDRIAPSLVANTMDELGERISPDPEAAETQAAPLTETDRYDDVHTALLWVPATGQYVLATSCSKNAAWTQRERDWEISEAGDEIVVTDAEIEALADTDDPVDDEIGYCQTWIEILFDEAVRGHEPADRRKFVSATTLRLEDEWEGRKAFATIALEDDD